MTNETPDFSEKMINEAQSAPLTELFKKIGKFQLKNPEPTYATVDNIISDDVSKKLIKLVDERGEESEWTYNPNCLEYQIANPYSQTPNTNDERVAEVFLDLYTIGEFLLKQINLNFCNSAFDAVTAHHGFWILKYKEGGSFDIHCDWTHEGGIDPSVLATAAIPLNEDYQGGQVLLVDSQGRPFEVRQKVNSAILWDGLTHHTVRPVTQGFRYVLIIHYVGKIK